MKKISLPKGKGLLKLLIGTFACWMMGCSADTKIQDVAPLTNLPDARQMAYQELELIGFAHFTVNTFTDREWGEGNEDPALFNPTDFDARQWVTACKAAGIKLLILTAKHHDGFCLWPSAVTNHSVKSSPWKNGQGDVVKEVADACREAGLKFGVYLSPWDMHEPSYGTPAYNDFYKTQLTELLTNYGEISEVWFDGAKGPEAKEMEYDFESFWKLVRELQPGAVLFSDAGPDVRWVGNEHGHAGETNWSTITRRGIEIGKADTKLLNMGDPNGEDWMVAECDVSIRPGWFYHPKEDTLVKSVAALMDIYYKSVGRNATLLLNIPPDRRGLFHETDVAMLKGFGEAIRGTFGNDFALGKPVRGSSKRGEHPHYHANLVTDADFYTYWAADDAQRTGSLEIDLVQPTTFNTVMLQEPVFMGQRIAGFTVYTWQNGQWETLTQGTTIGYKRLLKMASVTTNKLKVEITEANAVPLLAKVGVFEAVHP